MTDDAREDEMEENLAHVGSIVGNLKSMALDIGNELESQNDQIDRIRGKVPRSRRHINSELIVTLCHGEPARVHAEPLLQRLTSTNCSRTTHADMAADQSLLIYIQSGKLSEVCRTCH